MRCMIEHKIRVRFLACGGVLGHGVVLLHKSVQKVLTRVLRPVRDQAGGMKMGVQLLTRYTLFRSFKRHNIAIITHANCCGNIPAAHNVHAGSPGLQTWKSGSGCARVCIYAFITHANCCGNIPAAHNVHAGSPGLRTWKSGHRRHAFMPISLV